jgi:hypothetical protein
MYMKKQVSLLVVFIAANFFIFSSCNKDDDNPPPTKTKTQLITQSNWKFKAATVNGGDISGSLQACQKDNVMTFTVALSGTVDEGPTKCNAGDPQQNPFTWNFAANETTLHISTVLFTGGSSDFTLVSLTETELVVSQPFSVGPGVPQTVVVTFQH